MRFDVVTIFPEIIEGVINSSILKRAINKGIIEINIIDFRNFAFDKHKHVDDYAYGGGAGMLISVEPVHKALKSIENYQNAHKIITSPSGKKLEQKDVYRLAKLDHIIIICGHYEGIDSRINDYVDEEISIGDYVLTGGELPACVLIDSISRLIKDVISSESLDCESFTEGILEYPQYTRPVVYEDKKVPDVLLSGHHANIEKWKRFMALKETYNKRPDLLEKASLSEEDLKYLELIKNGKELELKY